MNKNYFIVPIIIILLACIVAGWSTSNMGNVNVRGLLNASNESTFNDNMDINGSIYPGTDDTFGLGNSTFRWLNGYIRDLYSINLESNLDGTGFNITAYEVTTTLIDTTNLEADNLESNLDGTGFNITSYEVTATLVDTTNLEADNLESNLDATGYSITASTELASITGDFDNLEATNLESNLDGTGFNITGVGLAWDSLHSYPSACPAGTYLTQLDDSVTCTALTNATGDFNVVGNLTVEGNAGFGEDDPDYVVTINDNLVLSNGVSQDAIDSAHFANSRTETVGGDIMASVQQLIVNLSAPKGTWAYTDQVFAETLPTNSQNIMKLIPTASYVFHYGAGTLSYASGTQVGIYADGQGTTEHAWGVEVAVLASDNATIEDAKVVKATLMTYTNTPTINTGHLFYGDSVNYQGEMGSVSGLTLNELAEATNNTYILLGTETIPEGNYSIYSDTTSSSYFGGNILLDNDANVTWKNGASISVNSTCIILSSPAGTGTHAVCD